MTSSFFNKSAGKNEIILVTVISLFLSLVLLLIAGQRSSDIRQMAQTVPSPQCLGGVCPTDTGMPTTNPDETTPGADATSTPEATVSPCPDNTTSVATYGHKKKSSHHKLDSEGLLKKLLELLQQLFEKLKEWFSGNSPTPGSGDPTPTEEAQPTEEVAPTDGTAPTEGVAPTIDPCAGSGGEATPPTETTIAPTEGTSATGTVAPTSGTSTTSPSGQAMPKDDQTGWKLVFSDDFTKDVAVGSFPGTVYSSKWDVYSDGTPDSAGGNGKPSKYYPSKVVSVKNGVLNKYLHSENGTPMAAAIIPKIAGKANGQGQIYGKYVVRFKSDSLKGFKTAWLLWADQGDFRTQGEVDFPEGELSGEINAFLHEANAAGQDVQDSYPSGVNYNSGWHTATIDWQPTKISFILDGKTIGSSTKGVPNTSMGYIIQTESCPETCPAASTKGNLQIDWVAIYARK